MQEIMEDVDGGPTKKRGVKRMADESNLSDEQRFAKRFNLLNLDSNATQKSHVYAPVRAAHDVELKAQPTSSEDGMQVDDTKDRVYIGNLDAEIADIEAHDPEERLIFLPDIEKHFSRIPHHVLVGDTTGSDHDAAAQQLVLYQEPKFLTNDDGNFSVKRAILESRKRAQDKAVAVATQEENKRGEESERDNTRAEMIHGCEAGEDTDVMDVD